MIWATSWKGSGYLISDVGYDKTGYNRWRGDGGGDLIPLGG